MHSPNVNKNQSPAADGRGMPGGGGLRIALIAEAMDTGMAQLIYLLARGLDQRGHQVHLLHSIRRMDSDILQRLRAQTRVRCVAFDMQRGIHATDMRIFASIRRYLKKQGPFDVIHGHSAKGGALARLCGIGLCPVRIYTPHAYYTLSPELSLFTRFLYRAIERALAYFGSDIICSSEIEKHHTEFLRIPLERVVVISNAIEPPVLMPRARDKLGIPDDAFVVGFVGRLEYQKAPDLLLRAVAASIRQNKSIWLVVVGSGSLEAQLREMARILDIEKHITWLGQQPSRHWLASFDILAMPSRYEGFSLMPLEAMYASLPIVCTSVGGIAESVCDGVTGIVVAQADETAFAAAILELSKDAQLRKAMASATRRRAGMFPPDAMVSGMEQIYRSALGRSRKGMREHFGEVRSSKSEGGC